jgi:hypothetical protein
VLTLSDCLHLCPSEGLRGLGIRTEEGPRRQLVRISDPLLVSYRHAVGYRRSPGNLASRVTRSIGKCRMSFVVSDGDQHPGSRLRRQLSADATSWENSRVCLVLVHIWSAFGSLKDQSADGGLDQAWL